MSIEFSTRPATTQDIGFARMTHHAAYRDVVIKQFGNFDKKIQDKFFADSWSDRAHEIFIFKSQPIGYESVEYLPDHIFVHELVILPEFQGLGIGSSFLRKLQAEARKKKIPIKLKVLKENSAKDFYQKLGFEVINSDDLHIKMKFNPA